MRKFTVDALTYAVSLLAGIAFGLGLALGCVLVLPCFLFSMWLADRGTDLRGGWMRGRDQNALWSWARRWRGLS